MQKLSSRSPERDRVIIRQAGVQDAQSIMILCQQLGYAATLVEIQQRLDKIQINENHIIYVATLEFNSIVKSSY